MYGLSDFTSFGVKLVDFGADGAFGGGDDVEHQVNFASPTQGEWVSLDIPLSEFTGLTTRESHCPVYFSWSTYRFSYCLC